MTDHHLCPMPEETIHLFLDGELPPAERQAFVAHLQACPACQFRLAELQTLFAKLDAWETMAAPEELVDQVMDSLPRPVSSPLIYLVLVGQVGTGLTLFLAVRPMLALSVDHRQMLAAFFERVSILSNGLGSLGGVVGHRLAEVASLGYHAGRFVEVLLTFWAGAGHRLVAGEWVSLSLSPGLIWGILGLAWLISNALLLRYKSASFNNGGAL